ncbi:MAG: trigger factor [Oscillospiraceae bacterium]|nr:trigger factor [Oscillospiraceae bacterium]
MEIISQNNTATNTYAIDVKFSAEEFEEAINAVYNRQKSRIAIPGFRKGKATRKIIESHYGENVFYEDAVNSLYSDNIEEIIDKTGLEVVDIENTQVTDVSRDNGVSLKADIITKPDVEISDYKGLSVKKTVKTVTDEAVDEEINKMRERVGRIVTVEGRAVQDGDTAVIDFEGFMDGVAFEGGKGEKFPLEIGSHSFIAGFEEQIIGKNAGDEFDVNVTFPEDYQAENLAGKPAVFKCKLHEIKAMDIPELNDDFVKDVSEKDTVDELKGEIKEKLAAQYATEADDQADSDLMDAMIGNMKAEIPQVMYERRIDEIAREWSARTRIDIKDYLKYTGMTMAQFRANFKDAAKRQVELRLCLEKIAELENVEITADDISKEYDNLAEEYKIDVENVKAAISEKTLISDLKIEKALDIVKDSANIEEVTE